MFEAVVIGGSAGSFEVLISLLGALPGDYPLPIIVVIHLHPSDNGDTAELINELINLKVSPALDKHPILPENVYMASADYHLLIEYDKTFALNVDEKVNFARPSIDVLFETAAFVYMDRLVGILLTGANKDGAKGTAAVKKRGGLTIVQDPALAEYPVMPRSAIDTGCVDRILSKDTMFEILR